jgi:Domain of unknown function (DUF4862)
MKIIIAGYTAAPVDPKLAETYYDRLLEEHDAGGLEFAWGGPQTPAQLAPLVARMPSNWTITLNDIPAVWRACVNNPKFGLASPDEHGRAQAVAMMGEVAQGVTALNDLAGRHVVQAFEIHSAPGFDKRILHPDAAALTRSLEEICQLEWEGAELMLEHCDAFLAGQAPAKGFLRLDAEIEALAAIPNQPVGLSLNWGRSMIELRSADRVIDHLRAGAASGLLRGYTFSGTADADNRFGQAWADSHLPFSKTIAGPYGEPASRMTPAHAAEALALLGGCSFIAIKTNWPAAQIDPLERAASVVANFRTLASLMQRDVAPGSSVGALSN